jgi:4-hydroxybenzoate polyprenyltransferase
MANITLSGGGRSRRWFLYCRERFPLLQSGAFVAAFTFATLRIADALDPRATSFDLRSFLAAFAVAFLFFLELRVLDEFKDADDDARYRPYRPVPRGLVSLRELAVVGVTAAAMQVAVATLAGPAATAWLVMTFAWMALMGREFFARAWLRARPVAYLASHTIVVPLIALTVAAFRGHAADIVALAPYLAFTCATSVVLELGRKLRAPTDEQTGVETYTALWGRRTAVIVWLASLAASAALAVAAAMATAGAWAIGAIGVAALVAGGVCGHRFLGRPVPGAGKALQALSGFWIIAAYVALGVVSHAAKQ